MKKCILIIIAFVLCINNVYAISVKYTALYVNSNKAFVNDVVKAIDSENEKVTVFVENDRAYVPVRFITENYGGVVKWDDKTQTVSIAIADKTIELCINKPEIDINGVKKELDAAPIIRNERTFLPLRACVEALDKHVFYDRDLIIISDIDNILDKDFDADIIALLISYFN